jgi:hypothetical protein
MCEHAEGVSVLGDDYGAVVAARFDAERHRRIAALLIEIRRTFRDAGLGNMK